LPGALDGAGARGHFINKRATNGNRTTSNAI
jgi:hypothetical protein